MKQEPLKFTNEIPSTIQQGIEYDSKAMFFTKQSNKTKLWIAVGIGIALILQAVGGFFMGRYYERSIYKNIPAVIVPRIENLNRSIQDTSANHEYNVIKGQVKAINDKLDFKLKPQLNEIKNNTGLQWNTVRNDSLFNAWRFFEAEYE